MTGGEGGQSVGICLAQTARHMFAEAFHTAIKEMRFGREQGEIACVVAVEC